MGVAHSTFYVSYIFWLIDLEKSFHNFILFIHFFFLPVLPTSLFQFTLCLALCLIVTVFCGVEQ